VAVTAEGWSLVSTPWLFLSYSLLQGYCWWMSLSFIHTFVSSTWMLLIPLRPGQFGFVTSTWVCIQGWCGEAMSFTSATRNISPFSHMWCSILQLCEWACLFMQMCQSVSISHLTYLHTATLSCHCTGWAKEKCTITNSKLFSYVTYKLALKLDTNTR